MSVSTNRPSLTLRLIGTALLASLVALVIAGLVISSLLRNFVEDTYAQTLDATMLAVMANVALDEELGRPVLRSGAADPRFQQPFSGWYWTISDAGSVLFRSGSLWSADIAVNGQVATGPRGESLMARTRSFSVPGGTTSLSITATAPRAAIQAQIGLVVTPLVIALAVLGLSLGLAQLAQVQIGLKPLRRMATNLKRIQRGELPALPDENYRELSPLIGQMNGLITHNHETLRRAREHVGNLAHALKTPLAVIETELARPAKAPDRDAALAAAAHSMDRHIAHHLRRARMAATTGAIQVQTPIAAVVEDLLPVFRGVYADRHLTFATALTPDRTFTGDRQDLEEMLGNLIDNACKWATSGISIELLVTNPSEILIAITDDGPGMDQEAMDAAGQRGRRFDETRPGTGLGLAIVRDIAALYGGRFDLAANAVGGLTASLVLPGR